MNKVFDIFRMKFVVDDYKLSVARNYAGHRMFSVLRREAQGIYILWEVGKGWTGRVVLVDNK